MSIETHDERLCKNCQNFKRRGARKSGWCCAHPPQPIDASPGYSFAWCFPEMEETDRCGEFTPRRSPKQ